MKLSGLNQEQLTIIGGDGRTGAPITCALAAGWIAEGLSNRGRVAVVAPDQRALGYWLGLAGVETWRTPIAERLASYAPDLNTFQRSAEVVAGRFGASMKSHKPELVLVIDHPDPDPASWAWLAKIPSVTQAIVMTTTATDSGVRVFPDDPDTVTKPKLIGGLLAAEDGTAFDIEVAGTRWQPDPSNDAFDGDVPTGAKWLFKKSKRSAEGIAAEWLAIAEATRIEAEQLDARAYLARYGLTPSLDDLPKSLRQCAPWLATANTGDDQ